LILKLIIAAAFYPNYFNSSPIDTQEAERFVLGHDIRNTVVLRNLPRDESILYADRIKEIFNICGENELRPTVHFDNTKAIIEFKSNCDKISSNVNLGVYMAVHFRLLRIPIRLRRFKAEYVESKLPNKYKNKKTIVTLKSGEINISTLSVNSQSEDDCTVNETTLTAKNGRMNAEYQITDEIRDVLRNPKLILPNESETKRLVQIKIGEVIECGHFWAQIDEQPHLRTLEEIQRVLNPPHSHSHLKLLKPSDLSHDMLCITDYYDSTVNPPKQYYRAQIINIDYKNEQVQVHFVDYGNKETKRFNELYMFLTEVHQYPFQAIECNIVNIKMSIIENPKGVWTTEATKHYCNIIENGLESTRYEWLKIKVYDISPDNVVNIQLFCGNDKNRISDDVGELMTKSKYAELAPLPQKNYKSEYMGSNARLSDRYSSNTDLFYIPRGEHNSKLVHNTAITQPKMVSRTLNNQSQQQHIPNRSHLFSDDTADSESQNNYKSSLFNDNLNLKRNDAFSIESNNKIENKVKECFYSNEEIEVRGPFSPLEVHYSAIANIGHFKNVKLERESINYVTLDDDPYNDDKRLLITSEITLNNHGNVLLLRKTCLMPKIPGITSLCSLLFAPTIELRVSENNDHYTGALCGLGYDNINKCSINPDNDIETTFDHKIDLKDISQINSVRCAINMIIGSETNAKNWIDNEVNLRYLQQKACNKLIE
jgi:hypothetical protein